jgi:tetrapyrrole methylase family protein/MazG family protein
MAEVIEGIYTKIVHRHPHVFGEADAKDAESVLKNWERLKAEERAAKGKAEASLLDGIVRTLPALTQAEKIQQRAARVGFDWPEIQGVLDKVDEELAEVRSAQTEAEQASELGDLLFAVVNLARWLKVDPESALRDTSRRFRTRFAEIEASARRQGKQVSDLSLDEMEALWQLAKGKE